MNSVIMILSNPLRPDPRVYKEAKSLVGHGFKVTVYAWDRECKYPKNEVVDGIVIKRVHVRSKYGNFFMFMVTAPIFWVLVSLRILVEGADTIHCHDFDTLIVGVAMKLINKNVKIIYDSHEVYVSRVSQYVPTILLFIFKWLEKLFCLFTDAVIVVTDFLKGRFSSKLIVTIMNTSFLPDQKMLQNNSSRINLKNEQNIFEVFYYGGLSVTRGLVYLIKAIRRLPGIQLYLAGKGPLVKQIKKICEDEINIIYLGWINQDEIEKHLMSCHLVYCVFDPNVEDTRFGIPTKMLEAMAYGVPVIVSRKTISEGIVNLERCGVAVTYGDIEEIRNAILNLKNNSDLCEALGQNGRNSAVRKYNWKSMEKRLLSLYKSLQT